MSSSAQNISYFVPSCSVRSYSASTPACLIYKIFFFCILSNRNFNYPESQQEISYVTRYTRCACNILRKSADTYPRKLILLFRLQKDTVVQLYIDLHVIVRLQKPLLGEISVFEISTVFYFQQEKLFLRNLNVDSYFGNISVIYILF